MSGVWLLRGMRPDGVLTTVDTEAEHQRAGPQAFTEAGIAPQRVRLIPGPRLDVLPRLTDGVYDLVFVRRRQAASTPTTSPRRCGCCAPAASWRSTTRCGTTGSADPAQRDAETVAIRELGQAVREHESLLPVLLPVGDGLLVGDAAGLTQPSLPSVTTRAGVGTYPPQDRGRGMAVRARAGGRPPS